jgi:hypothetical protein
MGIASEIQRLTRGTRWERAAGVQVLADVGHPQGITTWGTGWLVATAHVNDQSGELLAVTAEGEVVRRCTMRDGDRWHPGGLHRGSADGCLIALAEYRPASSTSVWRVDDDLQPELLFRVDDHLGAICQLNPSVIFAVSWGSRTLYLLDERGRVLDASPNPVHSIDFQDLQVLPDGHILATGVGGLETPHGRVQLGGYGLFDPENLALVMEAPVPAWMPSGRVATYNAAHTEATDTGLRLTCLVDDRVGEITTWETAGPHDSRAADPC